MAHIGRRIADAPVSPRVRASARSAAYVSSCTNAQYVGGDSTLRIWTMHGGCHASWGFEASCTLSANVPGRRETPRMYAEPASGRLAQLARASVLHTEGHRFESCIAHHLKWQNLVTNVQLSRVD